MEENARKNKKLWLLIIPIICIALIVISYLCLFKSNKPESNSKFNSIDNPQLDPNYNGIYDESSDLVKGIEFFNGEDKIIDNCVFSKLRFVSSPNMSSFYGKFTSNNDDITGSVNIKFTLYDADGNVIRSLENHLKNVEKGKEEVVYGQYFENVENVKSLGISIE